jgi:hypothetical protein
MDNKTTFFSNFNTEKTITNCSSAGFKNEETIEIDRFK